MTGLSIGDHQALLKEVLLWLPFILVPLGMAMMDFVVLLRVKFAHIHKPHHNMALNDDFTILVPIFGNIRYLKNIWFLKQYGPKVILCTTTKETPTFNVAINSIAKQYGFKIFRSEVHRSSIQHKPNPWSLFRKTLAQEDEIENIVLNGSARDEIIRDSFAAITTKYSIFIDGDTVANDDLTLLTGLMADKNYDIASVRVVASKTDAIMEKLQSVEYQISMDSRAIYPWLTSGAAMIAKTETIRNIMNHHSLFFSGGDIEIGKLAGIMKYKVGHLYFEFLTDVPSTFNAWFKQRIAWCGGGFRHAIVNFYRYSWRFPFFFFYTTIIVYGLTPLRWYEAVRRPWVIPEVIVLYWIIIFAFHWRRWQWFYWLFPFYSLIQVMIIIPLGIYTYFRMVHNQRNIGVIKLRKPVQPAPAAVLVEKA
jgi:Glycosyl transferase family group 2